MRRFLRLGWVLVGLGAAPAAAQFADEPPPLIDDSLGVFEALAEAPTGAPSPSFEDQLYQIINERRMDCAGANCTCAGNLPPMKRARILHLSSEFHSENMAIRNFFMHCDPDTGTSSWDRAEDFGWTGWTTFAENIAAGYNDPAAVMAGWMGSGGHCLAIASTRREVGAGFYQQIGDTGNVRQSATGQCPVQTSSNGPWTEYWTLNLSSRSAFYPLVIERERHTTSSTTIDLYLYDGGGSNKLMRFSDDGESWSSLTSYSASSVWVVPSGDGVKIIYSEFQSSTGTKRACDRIWLDSSGSTSDTIFRESFECGAESLGLWDSAVL